MSSTSQTPILNKEDAPIVLAGLLRIRDRDGQVTNAQVRSAADALGVCRSTVRAWIASGEIPTNERRHYELSPKDREAFHRCHGSISAAWRHRSAEEGEAFVSLRTFGRAVAREISKRGRALATGGDKGGDNFSHYASVQYEDRNGLLVLDSAQLNVPTVALGYKIPRNPHITLAIWAGCRAIGGAVVSFNRPTQDDVLAAIGMAMTHNPDRGPFHGLPDRIHSDNGPQFVSDGVTRAAALLQVDDTKSDAYMPSQNGIVERQIGTIKTELVRRLPLSQHGPRRRDGTLYESSPGSEALPFEYVVEEVQKYVDWFNLERQHPGINMMTPKEAWESDRSEIRTVDKETLRYFLLRGEERTVQKDGIHFKGVTYMAPELDAIVGNRIQVRYSANDLREIEIYDDRRWVCTAVPADSATPEMVLRLVEMRREAKRKELREVRRNARSTRLLIKSMTESGDAGIVNTMEKGKVEQEIRQRKRRTRKSASERARSLGYGRGDHRSGGLK